MPTSAVNGSLKINSNAIKSCLQIILVAKAHKDTVLTMERTVSVYISHLDLKLVIMLSSELVTERLCHVICYPHSSVVSPSNSIKPASFFLTAAGLPFEVLAAQEDRNLPPAQCGAHPRMPLLGAGWVTWG